MASWEPVVSLAAGIGVSGVLRIGSRHARTGGRRVVLESDNLHAAAVGEHPCYGTGVMDRFCKGGDAGERDDWWRAGGASRVGRRTSIIGQPASFLMKGEGNERCARKYTKAGGIQRCGRGQSEGHAAGRPAPSVVY
jgi:hypothetical protein